MEMISDRIGVVKGAEDLTVYIKASTRNDIKKLNLFRLWIAVWTVAGILIFSQLFFDLYTREQKMYIIIYMAFWGYFEYRAMKAYYFRKYGIETVYVNNDKFMLRRDILQKKGKPRYYKAGGKNPFQVIEEKTGLSSTYYNSFWVVTGGTIGFGDKEGNSRFGLQLPPQDARKLAKLLNSYVKIPQKTSH